MQFQDSEIVALFFGVIGLIVLVYVRGTVPFPGRRHFVAGYIAIFVAYVATVVEGVLWRPFFDTVEHLAYATSAALLLAGTWRLTRGAVDDEDAP